LLAITNTIAFSTSTFELKSAYFFFIKTRQRPQEPAPTNKYRRIDKLCSNWEERLVQSAPRGQHGKRTWPVVRRALNRTC
jgi:hypothetical protein